MTVTGRLRIAVSREDLEKICRRYAVTELRVSGSVLSDAFRDDSDIDVLVSFAPDARVGYFELARLQRELEALFGREVDVVSLQGLNPLIRQDALDSSMTLYAA